MNLKINRLDNLAAAVLPRHPLPPKISSRQARGASTDQESPPGIAARGWSVGIRAGKSGVPRAPQRRRQRLRGSGAFPGTGDKSCHSPHSCCLRREIFALPRGLRSPRGGICHQRYGCSASPLLTPHSHQQERIPLLQPSLEHPPAQQQRSIFPAGTCHGPGPAGPGSHWHSAAAPAACSRSKCSGAAAASSGAGALIASLCFHKSARGAWQREGGMAMSQAGDEHRHVTAMGRGDQPSLCYWDGVKGPGSPCHWGGKHASMPGAFPGREELLPSSTCTLGHLCVPWCPGMELGPAPMPSGSPGLGSPKRFPLGGICCLLLFLLLTPPRILSRPLGDLPCPRARGKLQT